MPGGPVLDLAAERVVEGLDDRGDGKRRGRVDALAEAEPENAARRDLGDQGDIAGPGGLVVPAERTVPVEILPAVAHPDIAGARLPEAVRLALVGRSEREVVVALLRRKQAARAVADDRGEVVVSGHPQPRGEENMRLQRRIALQAIADDQDVAIRVGRDL